MRSAARRGRWRLLRPVSWRAHRGASRLEDALAPVASWTGQVGCGACAACVVSLCERGRHDRGGACCFLHSVRDWPGQGRMPASSEHCVPWSVTVPCAGGLRRHQLLREDSTLDGVNPTHHPCMQDSLQETLSRTLHLSSSTAQSSASTACSSRQKRSGHEIHVLAAALLHSQCCQACYMTRRHAVGHSKPVGTTAACSDGGKAAQTHPLTTIHCKE